MNPDSEQKRIAFGYNRDAHGKIVLHVGQAAAVKLIYQYYLDGFSVARIKEALENMGLPSPLDREKWGKQTIANILSNPHYVGDETYPNIISKEQFEIVQEKKREKKNSDIH